jgi:hypothetical protein
MLGHQDFDSFDELEQEMLDDECTRQVIEAMANRPLQKAKQPTLVQHGEFWIPID